MKLAEALQERADLNRKIEQLKNRLNNNVLVQEGEQPAEAPEPLKRELDGCINRLAQLTAQINQTNSAVQVNGRTLTAMIAEKDALILKIGAYKTIAETASQTARRARGAEIRILPAIPGAAWQAEIDQMARALRLLDNTLQQTNWATDLIE